MVNVILTGAKGMLGSDLVPALRKAGHTVIAVDIENVDLTSEAAVLAMPGTDYVINCAAYTAVDKAEEEQDACTKINVGGVRNLVAYCRKHDAALVQLSTDYVFDGEQEGYDEEDQKNPLNHYGRTKADAEDVITQGLEKHYIVRTSWLFGRHGKNFVETVRSVCKEQGAMNVVNDQTGAPTYTGHLAGAIVGLLGKDYGTYHFPASGRCTWYEFAHAIKDLYKLDCKIAAVSSGELDRPAKRPKWSILNNNKGPKLPDWKRGLVAYMEEE